MSDETYHGWPNRMTWLVNLHHSSDEGVYLERSEIVAQARADGPADAERLARETALPYDPERRTRWMLAERLKDWTEEQTHRDGSDPGSLLASDLIGTALAEVDWDHYAAHLLAEDG